ncbi:MAG: SDR family NAD(P)-dependent oxidoreductase [Syntrophobacterales bacterium]|nr:MAG: SDR family NAD(P)-dependent oxidoreductase [Syntrophobacterales bacterium]
MEHFKDTVAIVTGGASGIGRALCEELSQRGTAEVIVADINAEGARQVASAITTRGGRAHAAHLDISQAGDVQKLVVDTASKHGRLDYMFNNAGIAIGGEMRDMGLEHWRRILDVNLWGVIYGTTSAYKVMVKQGFGHIVNTASLAGLTPVPLITAYATTKHAVVGLSTSLRAEGAELGVKVSVVCPGFIRTGIIDAIVNVTKLEKAYPDVSSINMMDAGDCARIILRGVVRNKAIITVTAFACFLWWLSRLHPAIAPLVFRKRLNEFRALRSES